MEDPKEKDGRGSVESPSISLVIPAYRSEAFLEGSLERACAWLASKNRRTQLVVVDDGSPDRTWEVLQSFAARNPGGSPEILAIRNRENRGKGFAVTRGMLEASGDIRIFTDADLTYPIECADRIVESLENGADLAIGSRLHPDSVYEVGAGFLRYIYTRHVSGRIFNLLVRLLVVPGILDTQAGLKGMRAEAAESILPRQRLLGFSFDVELLFLARRQGRRIEQVPVKFLYRKEPSTVRFVQDSFRMVLDMLRIRWRAFRGRYDR